MRIYLIFVSFAASTRVESNGWGTPALTELVEIMKEVVSLNDGWREFLKQPSILSSGLTNSRAVSRLNLNHELFASTLKQNFAIDSVEHATTIIRAIVEAVSEAQRDYNDLFEVILSLPSSNAQVLSETRDTFSGHWANLHRDLTDLQSRYEISSESPFPRTDSGEVDVATTKFVVDLAALGVFRRHLLSETYAHLHQFYEWLSTQQTGDNRSELISTLNITMIYLKRFSHKTPGEHLKLVLSAATEFESTTRLLSRTVLELDQPVSALVSSEPTVVEFLSVLKTSFAKRFKEVNVRSSVLVSRVSTELTKRADSRAEKVFVSDDPEEMTMDRMRIELIAVMEQAVALGEECGKFIIGLFAKGGLFGHKKFEGLTRYRRTFANIMGFKPSVLKNQQALIGVSEEAMADFVVYIKTLFSELDQLGLLDKGGEESQRPWITEWKSLHEQLVQLRTKHNVENTRHSAPATGLYHSDPVVILYVNQTLGLFNRTRKLLAELFGDLVEMREWISTNRKFFSQKVKAHKELESRIMAVIEETNLIESFSVYEDLEALLASLAHVEGLDNRFKTLVSQLVEFMSSLQIRGDDNRVSQFFQLLRKRYIPQLTKCLKADSQLRRNIEEAIVFRKGGLVKRDLAADELAVEDFAGSLTPNDAVDSTSADREEAFAEQTANRNSGATTPILNVQETEDHHSSGEDASQEQFDDFMLGEFQTVLNRKERRARAAQARISEAEKPQEPLSNIPPTPAAQARPSDADNLVQPLVKVEPSSAAQALLSEDEKPQELLLQVVPTASAVQALPSDEEKSQEPLLQVVTSYSSPTPCANAKQIPCAGCPVDNPIHKARNQRRRRKPVVLSSEVSMNQEQAVIPAPLSVDGPVTNFHQSGVATQQQETDPRVASRRVDPRRQFDPRMDMCMHRLMQLTEQSYHTYSEMFHLCGSMSPHLWSSGNIPGAQFVGSTQKLAHDAIVNTQVVHSFVYAAWQSQFNSRH